MLKEYLMGKLMVGRKVLQKESTMANQMGERMVGLMDYRMVLRTADRMANPMVY